MSESVIADFVGSFNSEVTKGSEPIRGRIVLSQKRLVLAADGGKVTIPLSAIFDVSVGQVPEDMGDFFNSTVTVAFERNDRQMVAAIEGDDEKIEKFTTVLFKAILNGTDVTLKHPARVGGRVTGNDFVPAKLFLKPRTVRFKRKSGAVDISLTTVSDFEQITREIRGSDRPVLAVKHMSDGQSMTTFAATATTRTMTILRRYLRLEYGELKAELEDVELTDEQVETLVAIYSTGQGVALASVLDMEGSQVTMVLNDLEADELVANTESGPKLTPKGRVVVSQHLEDVNA